MAVRGTAEGDVDRRWMFSARWIPGVDEDRARLRTTLAYRFAPTFSAGLEYNPVANDLGPIANWLALQETESAPALIFGTSSDRIGTPHGRAIFGTFSKDLSAWTGLPIAPYAGASFGTFDDELVAIGGLSILWFNSFTTTSMWDGHNLHHTLDVPIGDSQSLGLVVVDIDGEVDVGLTYSIGF